MKLPLRVLIVEDNPADAELVLRAFRQAGFQFTHDIVATEAGYLEHLDADLDIILSDYDLPQFSGMRAFDLMQERRLDIPFILVSGTIGEDLAVAAMKRGVADYLLKDRLARLGPSVAQAVARARLRKERAHTEQALRESEERFRQVVQNIEEVFWMTNVEKTEVLFVSAAYEKIWGRTCESLYASPESWFDAIHPDDRERVHLAVTTTQAAGNYHEEYRIVRPDGSIRWISDRAFVVKDSEGVVYRLAGVAEDVTERHHTEEALQDQAAMLNLAPDAIIVRRFDDQVITYWNQGAEHLYGWSSAEALGREIGELIFADPAVLDTISASLLERDEWRGELRHVSKDGTKLTVSTRATLVRTASGGPKSVLEIDTNITEQKDLEERFLRAQRMESIGTLAGGIAHDLNNILAPIMMSVPMLRRDLPQHQRDELLSTLEISANRGAAIVRQVLTFGRGLEGVRHPLQLGVVIDEITKIVQETFPKNITMQSSRSSDLWIVIGDATQLHQVLLNLCVNARDAMPTGGTLSLHARNQDLDQSYASMLPGATPGPNVVLEVSDSGVGISPEVIDRIFDPFFTTKGVGKGTGLGLSTVMGIVKSHGGHVGATSQQGGGTKFEIYLPASPDSAALAESRHTSAEPPLGKGEWVLIVDDEEEVRRSARIVLETYGYKVLTAADGIEALTTFAQNSGKLEVVVTDLMMPHMDGIALIQVLRKMNAQIPIIASSGLREKGQLEELELHNVVSILNKPYGADTLLRCIRGALTGLVTEPVKQCN